ncbi:MarR family transcriptional regulator [Modestobacter sp. NPDC049651]|uniref:MarR family winged helix-turn-helix transcriptional regulator n=1 Tax=unclassified Modestobacter TaxID=2643866 RepID=UPI0033E830C4
MAREELTAAVQRELTVFARRVRRQPQRLRQELPFVAWSMLSSIDGAEGTRAVDLATRFRLDKSTVSRQVGDLERRGLVVRGQGPAGGGRGQVLRLTPAGRRLLDEAAATRRTELARRVAGWSEDELAAFAAALQRYNAAEPD